MDGLQWKTLLKWDDLGGFPPIFGSTPTSTHSWWKFSASHSLVDHGVVICLTKISLKSGVPSPETKTRPFWNAKTVGS